jgi:uncharacterized protein YpbB
MSAQEKTLSNVVEISRKREELYNKNKKEKMAKIKKIKDSFSDFEIKLALTGTSEDIQELVKKFLASI